MKASIAVPLRWRALLLICGLTYIVWMIDCTQGAQLGSASTDLRPVKWALGQVETGAANEGRCAADRTRGKHQEVSRYQVLPELWHQQTASNDYANPALAWVVAQAILTERIIWFRRRAGRELGAFDLYVMWNAPSHYQAVGFQPRRVRRAVAERAWRFANLVEGRKPVPLRNTH